MSNEYWIADETASPPSSVWETGLPERRVQERPSRATVLVVEDNDDDFELVAAGLSSVAGISFELEQATRLSQALDRLAAGGVDLVLLDLSLPDSSGPETFLKTHAAAPAVPIIVLTGLHDEELGIQAVQQGAEDYLIKGAGASPLVRSMRYAMARHYVRARLEHTLQELQTSEANLRTVIDGNADGLLILDPQGLVLFANLAAEELWIRKGLALLDEPVSFPVPGQGASQIELPDESGKRRTIDLRVAAIQWRGQPARLLAPYRSLFRPSQHHGDVGAAALANDSDDDLFAGMLAFDCGEEIVLSFHVVAVDGHNQVGGLTIDTLDNERAGSFSR